MKQSHVFVMLAVLLTKSVLPEKLPVVLWHGMGDTCCFPFSVGGFKKFLENELGIYCKSIEIGNSIVSDFKSGYFVHPNKQVESVCADLMNDTNLSNGYNGIGFSQGGQFMRALAQRCPWPRMNNLITLGGQHQGVFGLPNCPSLSSKTCEGFRRMLNNAAYTDFMQNHLVQATYWHDPLNEITYKNSSTFLADINNERTINQSYIQNLQSLKTFIMVRFNKDSIVQPLDSQWFGYYKPGQDVQTQSLRESDVYIQDRLGLKLMDAENKIVFLECDGNHLQFTKEWVRKKLFKYLQ
ncbi:palmitoyl-protein thioesterase 1 [Anopheles aquasalis]|uniref:palmitoyl-protein thioesterase 1 n=1 Tax=Anopheles aquasalis TaxID=42839 RepID=UPI00215B40EA|nr:palmitoyl-protein thioesterase 1 [Anopheles aquasalis]